jgi:hypothetical protein
MALQNSEKSVLLFKNGVTLPAAADVVTLNAPFMPKPTIKSGEYKDIGNGVRGSTKGYKIADMTTIDDSIEVLVRGSGAAGTAPKMAELLKSCGLAETVVASTSVAYKPASTFTAGNALVYLDGEKRAITGIACDFGISGSIGELAKMSFTMKGFTSAVPTLEASPVVTLSAVSPLVVESITAVLVGGSSVNLTKFDFKMGNDIQEAYGVNTKEYYLADFKPTITIDAIKTKDNIAHWTALSSSATVAILITLGTVAGNKVEISVPYAFNSTTSESDESGKVIFNQSYVAQAVAGNDNFTITFK